MGRVHPAELRERAIALVESGLTHRATAERLCVSVKFVNDMVKLKRQTGDLLPRKQGTPKPGKLAPVTNWIVQCVSEKSDITLDELVAELEATHGLSVNRVSIWRLLRRLGLSHKKTLQAIEQLRSDVMRNRHHWITKQSVCHSCIRP